jgi:hypothetical protein
MLLDKHFASEHVSSPLTPKFGKAFGVLHSQEDVMLELLVGERMDAAR